jgi:hypothetical protein
MPIRVGDRFTGSSTCDRAVVFAFVADHQNLPAWTVGAKKSERLTGGLRPSGSRYRVVGTLLGRTATRSRLRARLQLAGHDRGDPAAGQADHRRLKAIMEHPALARPAAPVGEVPP